MLTPPFRIVRCNGPRPAHHSNRCWTGEPEWDAPSMPVLPQPRWELLHGAPAWTIDWREFFRTGLKPFDIRQSGEMRGFHLVFHIRPAFTGRLVFFDDDGCIVRRKGELVHCDRSAHGATRHELEVKRSELLEIAQWQLDGAWTWAAAPDGPPEIDAEALLEEARGEVERRLASPDGPPLKIYTSGSTPLRTALAVYSMILRGYAPESVLLYGDYQWNPAASAFFARTLPFARVVPHAEVIAAIERCGPRDLAVLASRHWFVMKTCVALLCEPREFGMMDDDIFILGPVAGALEQLRDHVFVFCPDADYEQLYLSLWGALLGRNRLDATRRLNTGLFWMRNPHDPHRIASLLHRGSHNLGPMGLWEQGFFAALFADSPCHQLPADRYFYPLFDGLPGGILGYDYDANPCGFASVHFGGLVEKPSDEAVRWLAPQLLRNGRP